MSTGRTNPTEIARESPPGEAPQERFRLVELLVLTGCIAACFGWFRLALEFQGVDLSAVETAIVEWGLRAVIGGTAVAGVFLVGPRVLIQGRSVSPGEWLWLLLGIEWAVRTVLAACVLFVELVVADGQPAEHMLVIYRVALALTAAALSVSSAKVVRWVSLVRWRVSLVFVLIVFAIDAFLPLVDLVLISAFDMLIGLPLHSAVETLAAIENHVFKLAVVPVLLATVVCDLWSGRAFPWRHWMGGAVFLSGMVFTSSYLWGWP